jgi:two-component system, NarL family, invasion response regulator UvrY
MITIGLIDDHDLFRTSLRTLLTVSGFFSISIEAADGEEFLSKIKSGKNIPDVIVTDFQMPKLNGKGLIERLRNKYPSVRIVVLSMFTHFHLVSSIVEAGASGFLSKGIKANALIDAITSVAKGKFVLSVDDSFQSVNISELNLIKENLVSLTPRQIDFLNLCANPNLTYKEIADQLSISPKTADRYRDELFKKLKINSRAGLLLYAIETGFLPK